MTGTIKSKLTGSGKDEDGKKKDADKRNVQMSRQECTQRTLKKLRNYGVIY